MLRIEGCLKGREGVGRGRLLHELKQDQLSKRRTKPDGRVELTISLILSSCMTFQNLFPGRYTSNDNSSPGGSSSGETSLETTSGSSVSPFERVTIPPSPSSEKATRLHSRGASSSSPSEDSEVSSLVEDERGSLTTIFFFLEGGGGGAAVGSTARGPGTSSVEEGVVAEAEAEALAAEV